MRKIYACAVSAAFVLAVLHPIAENWKDEPRDGFPLSYYPMFSKDRGAYGLVTHFVGIDDRGRRTKVHARYSGLHGGMNQARKQIVKIVDHGGADDLCRAVAAGVAGAAESDLAAIREIRVVTGSYSLTGYFRGRTAPVEEAVHARCPVRGRA